MEESCSIHRTPLGSSDRCIGADSSHVVADNPRSHSRSTKSLKYPISGCSGVPMRSALSRNLLKLSHAVSGTRAQLWQAAKLQESGPLSVGTEPHADRVRRTPHRSAQRFTQDSIEDPRPAHLRPIAHTRPARSAETTSRSRRTNPPQLDRGRDCGQTSSHPRTSPNRTRN